jgi:hypothetical protein
MVRWLMNWKGFGHKWSWPNQGTILTFAWEKHMESQSAWQVSHPRFELEFLSRKCLEVLLLWHLAQWFILQLQPELMYMFYHLVILYNNLITEFIQILGVYSSNQHFLITCVVSSPEFFILFKYVISIPLWTWLMAVFIMFPNKILFSVLHYTKSHIINCVCINICV